MRYEYTDYASVMRAAFDLHVSAIWKREARGGDCDGLW